MVGFNNYSSLHTSFIDNYFFVIYLFYHLYYKLKAQHTLIHYLQYIFVAKGKKIYTYTK